MKILITILVFLTLAANAAEKRAKKEPDSKVAIAQKHKFSAMKLRGQLKRPELKLHEDGTGLREDTLPEIPSDFDNESIKDVE